MDVSINAYPNMHGTSIYIYVDTPICDPAITLKNIQEND